MAKFRVTLTVAGYCRGERIYEVEAADEAAAREGLYEGSKITLCTHTPFTAAVKRITGGKS